MTDKQVVKYSIVEAEISKWKSIYMDLAIDDLNDKEQFESVHSARMIVKNGRVAIEKERKSLNSDAIAWQKKVNGKAKELFALIEPIETHLQNEEDKVIKEQERIKAEEAEKERIKIQSRVDELMKVECVMPFMEVAILTDEEFSDLLQGKTQEWEDEQERKAKEEADRKAEEERLSKQKAEQEAEAARLKKQADEIAAQQKAIQDEKDRIEAEKRAEQERKEREEFERKAKEEARIQAEKDAKDKAEREAKEAKERELVAAEEAKRIEALKPDKERLKKWILDFAIPDMPELSKIEVKEIGRICVEYLEDTLRKALEQIEAL